MSTMTKLSATTTSHEQYIKITAVPKFWRPLGTLGMKAAVGSSDRLVIFLRNYTATHFRTTDRPKTLLCTNKKTHKWSLYGFHVWQLLYRGEGETEVHPTFILPWPLKKGPIGCPERSVRNYHSTLRKIPKERRYHLNRGGSLQSRIFYLHIFSSI